jgi:ketosteroid isomerase-like protein
VTGPSHSALPAQLAFATAVTQLDWSALGKLLHDDLRYVHSFGRADSKADLLKNIARFTTCLRWENLNLHERTFGDIAIVTSDLYTTLQSPERGLQNSQQRAVDVWRKVDDQWLLLVHQSTAFS